ncbi:MAG: hypothetical protein JSV94_04150, partial [Methanobacteriota archaeon]
KLERERAEIQDLWERVEGAKDGLSAVDEKTIEELETRKAQLNDAYLRIAEREEELRADEQRLELEWERMHSIEEDLAKLANILKSREEQLKKLE